PLLVTARGRDVLYVEYRAGNEIQFGFVHTGAEGRVGAPVAITPNRDHDLTIDLGSLYPPKDHPLMAALTEAQADALLRRVLVTLDGRTVLESNATFYPGDPGDLLVGRDPYPYVAPGRFSGRLQVLGRRGIPAPASLHGPAGDGPVRLTVSFPAFTAFHTEPLVSTGHPGAGDLLYVTYVAPGRIRFGHDDSGGGSVETQDVEYTPGREYVLDVDMGSLHADRTQETFDGPLVVDFDERRLIESQRQFHATTPIEIAFGFNSMESSVSKAMFAGQIVAVDRPRVLRPDTEEPLNAGEGALRLKLRFPQSRMTHQEPLLVTGQPGAADVVYVVYAGPGEVRLGYDHWGHGGPVSAPLAVDYRLPHVVDISLGSLYPAPGSKAWGDTPQPVRQQALGTVVVKLDGHTVITRAGTAYPAIGAKMTIGRNTVGASTAEYRFTGTILGYEFAGLPGHPGQP
ncbi:MAG TPA: hypothetical protein VMD31_01975, partial [Opitutaceae bacterium]|nr:hypothetical protein [Opitutaceae bacterium]